MFRRDFESLEGIHTELLRIINTNERLSTLEIDTISDMIAKLETVFGIS